jgi:hypothetical protein
MIFTAGLSNLATRSRSHTIMIVVTPEEPAPSGVGSNNSKFTTVAPSKL